jgi:hypothetical protein
MFPTSAAKVFLLGADVDCRAGKYLGHAGGNEIYPR